MKTETGKKRQGILFDLDGTLWDACSGIASAWEEYIRLHEPAWYEKGVRVEEKTVRSACGKTMDVFTAMVLHQLPTEEQRRLYEPCCAYENSWLRRHGAKLYDGVKETLRELSQNYLLFIVSNCQEGYIEAFTGWTGLEDLIADTENYGRTLLSKDENIRLVTDRNALDRAVYVGDTEGDLESASRAGIPFIHAAYGFGKLEREDIPAIRSFRELPHLLEDFW